MGHVLVVVLLYRLVGVVQLLHVRIDRRLFVLSDWIELRMLLLFRQICHEQNHRRFNVIFLLA